MKSKKGRSIVLLLVAVLGVVSLGSAIYLASGAGETPAQIFEPQMPFQDVAEDSGYYEAVRLCDEAGALEGLSSQTNWDPDAPLSRGAAVQMLWNMAGAPVGEMDGSFLDVADNTDFCQAVYWAKGCGVVDGGDGYFRPEQQMTNQEFFVMLYRYAVLRQHITPEQVSAYQFDERENRILAQVDPYARMAARWTLRNGGETWILGANQPINRGLGTVILKWYLDAWGTATLHVSSAQPVQIVNARSQVLQLEGGNPPSGTMPVLRGSYDKDSYTVLVPESDWFRVEPAGKKVTIGLIAGRANLQVTGKGCQQIELYAENRLRLAGEKMQLQLTFTDSYTGQGRSGMFDTVTLSAECTDLAEFQMEQATLQLHSDCAKWSMKLWPMDNTGWVRETVNVPTPDASIAFMNAPDAQQRYFTVK